MTYIIRLASSMFPISRSVNVGRGPTIAAAMNNADQPLRLLGFSSSQIEAMDTGLVQHRGDEWTLELRSEMK